MSWPTSSSSAAFNPDADYLERGVFHSASSQDSGPLEDERLSAHLQCEYCSKIFSKQFELTLVSFPNLLKN
jgi:hypothetical protein